MGGGPKGNGKKARAGLVRAIMAHKGYAADARHWAGDVSKQYRMILLAEGEEKLKEVAGEDGKREVRVTKKGMKKEVVGAELAQLERSRDVAYFSTEPASQRRNMKFLRSPIVILPYGASINIRLHALQQG